MNDNEEKAAIDIKIANQLGLNNVRKPVEVIANRYKNTNNLEWTWDNVNPNNMFFYSNTGKAKGLNGLVSITESYIQIKIDLPIILRLFKTAIENDIRMQLEYLDKCVDMQKNGDVIENVVSNTNSGKSKRIKDNNKGKNQINFTDGILLSFIGKSFDSMLKQSKMTIGNSVGSGNSLMNFLVIAGKEEYETLSSPFWRWLLILVCSFGCFVNAATVIHGTNMLITVGNPVPSYGMSLLAIFPIFILFLSKQILMDRMGGGTFLFIFFVIFWAVCFIFNVAAIYWVY